MLDQPIRADLRRVVNVQQLAQIYQRMPWGHRLSRSLSMGLQALIGARMRYGSGLPLHTRLQVNFENAGSKWLVAAYAKLTPL